MSDKVNAENPTLNDAKSSSISIPEIELGGCGCIAASCTDFKAIGKNACKGCSLNDKNMRYTKEDYL